MDGSCGVMVSIWDSEFHDPSSNLGGTYIIFLFFLCFCLCIVFLLSVCVCVRARACMRACVCDLVCTCDCVCMHVSLRRSWFTLYSNTGTEGRWDGLVNPSRQPGASLVTRQCGEHVPTLQCQFHCHKTTSPLQSLWQGLYEPLEYCCNSVQCTYISHSY